MSILSVLAIIIFVVWWGWEIHSYRLVKWYYKDAGEKIDFASEMLDSGKMSGTEAAERIISADRDLQELVSRERENTNTRMMIAIVVLVALAVIGSFAA